MGKFVNTFSCNNVFKDIASYNEIQQVLREEIVNPLRKDLFVCSDRVMKLRELLKKWSSVKDITCKEKDPDEFLQPIYVPWD